MSIRDIPLFVRGRPTTFFILQWAKKGALQPIQASVQYIEPDGTAKPLLRQLWDGAMPSRDPLPFDPLVDADGRGTERFWRVFR